MKGANYFITAFVFAFCLSSLSFIAATSVYDNQAYVANYPSANLAIKDPTFVVQVLKYDPYPVNAGDWFDLWVKVQNVGDNDANDAVFELKTDYPFSSNETLVRDYGLIYGKANSFKIDQTYDASQVILKYRVKAEANSPSGISNLKLIAKTNGVSSSGVSYDLPVEVFSSNAENNIVPLVGSEQPFMKWIYGIIGLVCGIFLMIVIVLVRNKVKSNKHQD